MYVWYEGIEAAEQKNIIECKKKMHVFSMAVENLDSGILEKLIDFLTCTWWIAMETYRLFLYSDYDVESPERGPHTKKVWDAVSRHSFSNQPQELRDKMRKKFHELYPEITPIGYTDEGVACYPISKIAETLGLGEQEIVDELKEHDDAVVPSDKVNTIQ